MTDEERDLSDLCVAIIQDICELEYNDGADELRSEWLHISVRDLKIILSRHIRGIQ